MDSTQQSSKSVRTTFRPRGAPVSNPELFTTAWAECVELQCQDKAEWTSRTLHVLSSFDRYEVAAVVDGAVIGGVVVAVDEDIHVGPCVSVFAQYVLPEYRNRGASLACMRESVRLAKELGASVLAYTHRIGPWRYETIYRRIN